jgi:hypothetical protein
MDLTEKEIETVKLAQKHVARARFFGPFTFAIFLVFLAPYFFGYMSDRELLFFLLPAIFFMLFWQQVRGAPRYSELVRLLAKTLEKEPDPIIDALTRKP